MATEYGIIVKAHADLKDFKDELRTKIKDEEQKTKVDIKVKADEKALDKVHEKFNVIGKDYELIDRKFKTGLELKVKEESFDKKTGKMITTLKTVKKNIDVVIDTYKNLDGTIQKVESVLWHHGSVTEVLSQRVTSVEKSTKNLNKTLKESTGVTERVVNKYRSLTGVLHTITEETLANGNKLRTFVTEYEKDGQKIKEVSQRISEDGGKHWKKYGNDLKEVINDETKLAEAHKKVQQVYSETNIYKTKSGKDVTRTYTKDSDGTEHQKLLIQYEDEKGKKVQETTELIKEQGKAWQKNGETSKTVINDEINQQEKLAQSVKKVYEETTKYQNAKKQDVTRTVSKDSDGTWHATITKEYTESGKKIQEVTEYIKKQGEAWKTEGETSKKVVNDELARDKELKKSREDALNQLVREKEAIRKRNEEWKKANTYTTNYKNKEKEVLNLRDKTIHKLQTETKEIKDKTGAVKTVTTLSDKWVDSQGMLHTKLTETTKTVNKYGKEVGKATTKITENVEKSRTGLNQLGQSFSDIIVKVAKFYLASLPIRAMQTAITGAIQSVKDFDSALTEFKKVSDLSGQSLDSYTEKLEQLGKLTARTRTEMVELATEFKRSGFDDNDAATLAQIGSLYQNIADEELSASDAASVLISQIKAFNFQAEDAEHVIDAVNEVANRNAVSSGDIGRGLTQAGAALSTYGNTFEETIGLILGQLKPI